MFGITNFFSMVFLMTVSTRVANAFKVTSHRWMRASAISMQADATPAVNSGDRINKLIELDSPKVVSTISLNAGEKCVVCRCWKRFVCLYNTNGSIFEPSPTNDVDRMILKNL